MAMDDKTRTELRGRLPFAARSGICVNATDAEHRPDESGRFLPQLPVELVKEAADERRGAELG